MFYVKLTTFESKSDSLLFIFSNRANFFLFFFFFSWARPVLQEVVFVGLLFREHPKAQPEGGFRRSPGSNLRPLVYKASYHCTTEASNRANFFQSCGFLGYLLAMHTSFV